MEKKLNAVEYAIKVTSFRKLVRDICRKNGLEYPSDEKISEYINDCGGLECVLDINDFMSDYETKDGVFREPITDFINEVNKITWLKKPTEDEIKAFFEKNGNNIDLFCQQRTIAELRPFERDLLLATLKLADFQLVKLWNLFVEESGLYGADSYIYDLRDKADVDFINKNFPNGIKAEITRINTDFNLHGKTLRFIQWHNLNDGKLYTKEDIKGIIIAYWSEIFDRIMGYAFCYQYLRTDELNYEYLEDLVWPICRKYLGYSFDERNGEVKYIGGYLDVKTANEAIAKAFEEGVEHGKRH